MSENTGPESSGDELEAARRKKLARIQELGHDPWGGRFDGHAAIGQLRDQVGEIKLKTADGQLLDLPELTQIETTDKKGRPTTQWVLADTVGNDKPTQFREWTSQHEGAEMAGPKVRAAGRIVLQRDKGKLLFVDVQDWTGRIQIFIGKDQVGDDNWELAQCFDLGDIIGVDGELRRTKVGEISIFAENLHFLTKSIETPPEKHKGLVDPELRQRMRYLDLTYGDGVLERFLRRTKIVQSIRNTLARDNYVEIEGPTLHSIAGGAAARPFITHHNALGMQLYMRIALELHLKRLMVGGIERVYELGRVYRNEGIDQQHNPEFTMLEVYQSYGDYGTMMDLCERIIVDAIDASGQGTVLPWGDEQIDFTPPFARKTYDELFQQQTGVDPQDAVAIKALADKIGLETAHKHPDVIKNEVFEVKVEDALEGPIFVLDYPSSICPLTKRKRDNPAVAERFELFVKGMELANAYTELNDPDLQEELFRTQLEGLPDEDSMAKMDHDFIRALRHGMPPAGGMGIGIDRLVMLLTGSQSIRDVILFPLLRHERRDGEPQEAAE